MHSNTSSTDNSWLYNNWKLDNRTQMISDSAYFRAEKRGFVSGYEKADWMDAEKEINHLPINYKWSQ